MIDYSRIYEVRKQKKGKNYNREKKRKLYNSFIKVSLIVIILLAIVSLLSGLGQLIIYLSSASFLIAIGNGLASIGNIAFSNLGIIFFLVVIISITNNLKAIVVGLFVLLFFFSFQQLFIEYSYDSINMQFKSFLFFYSNSNVINNLSSIFGLLYLKLPLLGGIVLGILCSYIFNKYHEYRLPKKIGFLNEIPFVTIILIPIIIVFDFVYLLFFIGFNEVVILFNDVLIKNNNVGNLIGAGLLSMLVKFLGFDQIEHGGAFLPLYSYDAFLSNFMHAANQHGWYQSPFNNKEWYNENNVISEELTRVWEYLQNQWFGNKKFSNLTWINLLSIGNLPINPEGTLAPFSKWFVSGSINDVLVANYNQTNALTFALAFSMGFVSISTAKKENRFSTISIIILISGSALLTGNLWPLELLFMFVTPFLYFLMYVPINLFNWVIMFGLGMYVPLDYSQGLLLFLITGFKYHALFSNLNLVIILNICWVTIITPIFYRYAKWNNFSLVGYQEEILPRITKRQYHEIFNH
ncbi:putative PTS system protein [Spiroplasma syrphidicola EA-1]|uniref:Putative PTS system protein n=1 Tax=Spiroplasma syrphidicola EA-1 TaxID=1276229 RepID=R4U4G8_9MOLU|nr:hypothetical protein [Spiroplasma syrphidicola]AGM26377.1 putative PTS system protein [Spiroplasma syrphidicola EA-1]